MKITSDEKKHLKEFEKLLSYSFRRREHLKRALMHKSYANENGYPPTDHNERYEYLGDAVLELAISHMLFEHLPDQPEGELSKLRAAIVNEKQLALIAKDVNLGKFMYLGKGEDQTGGRDKPSLVSDTFEAVFGAVYLDRGFKHAQKVIRRHFKETVDEVAKKGFYQDYKTRLQEVAQERFRTIPRYKLVGEFGPDHSKMFEIQLFIGSKLYGIGRGLSKKAAEQDAARETLAKLGE